MNEVEVAEAELVEDDERPTDSPPIQEHDEVVEEPTLVAALDIEVYKPSLVMTPAEAGGQAEAIREMTRAVLRENIDYGVIPGTKKPSLFKPGAEWLLKMYGLTHSMEAGETIVEDGKPFGVTYRCTVRKVIGTTSHVIATCDGHASKDEGKWKTAPWNTIIKMAQKRALVGAALQATGTSGLFTQDMEDQLQTKGADLRYVELLGAIEDQIVQLTDTERDVLRRWWVKQGFPKTQQLGVGQAVVVLVNIGGVKAGQPPVMATLPEHQHRRLMALLTKLDLNTDEARHKLVSEWTEGRTESSKSLTPAEATALIEHLQDMKATPEEG